MRFLTRYDFDGLGCAVLLKEIGLVEEIKFVHPKDIQDGIIEVNRNDVLTNIPYAAGCGLWFDHHSSEHERKVLAISTASVIPPPQVRRVWSTTTTGASALSPVPLSTISSMP